MYDKRLAVIEMARVTRAGGILVTEAPRAPFPKVHASDTFTFSFDSLRRLLGDHYVVEDDAHWSAEMVTNYRTAKETRIDVALSVVNTRGENIVLSGAFPVLKTPEKVYWSEKIFDDPDGSPRHEQRIYAAA